MMIPVKWCSRILALLDANPSSAHDILEALSGLLSRWRVLPCASLGAAFCRLRRMQHVQCTMVHDFNFHKAFLKPLMGQKKSQTDPQPF
eukprot:3144365-Amphidinium_carterae.1